MTKDRTKSLTLRIPTEVHQKLKILAAIQETTMTEILIKCVEQLYEKQKKEGSIP
jgi:predicted HicB family RNase H-like nuclease